MSNIQKQHKISPAIAWLTIQKFIIFYCPLDGEHTTGGWASSFLRLLISRGAVPINLIVSHGVAVLAHGITGVALHGVDAAILHLLHNPYMVG